MSWWHAVWEFEKNIDPTLVALILINGLVWGIGGWAVCQATHKQRGIEVDRPITDVLPMPPPPVVVPDHVPEEWTEETEDV